ncbi:MAG: sensor histidine kinase [Flavobacteriales bacterium]|nr:sensor histidine kinase [Flavobacteriales bacterium]
MSQISPRQVALYAALVVGLVLALVLVVLLVAGTVQAPVWVAVLLPLFAAGATYVLVAVGVEQFVHRRIKLIHRIIHDQRVRRTEDHDQRGDELKRMEQEVRDWASERRMEISELKEREAFRREFIGNLAHELKTPIFNIQGYILTLLEGGLEDEKVNRDFLNRASNGVDRLIKIVDDLDMITRLESGVLALEVRRMDLRDLVDEMIKAMEMRAGEQGITLRSLVPDETFVQGDRDRLAQVFTNLFANAINYGRPNGWCEVRVFDLGEQVLVEVADNGIGIAEEHLPRLFERFYRVGKSRARNEGGSGLGLAICKHIIDAHGQSITAKSTEGEGTTFGFTLRKAR